MDKYSGYIVLYVFICFFWIKLLHMNISIDLASGIDEYVEVYNIIKHNSFLLIFTIKSKNLITITSPLSLKK